MIDAAESGRGAQAVGGDVMEMKLGELIRALFYFHHFAAFQKQQHRVAGLRMRIDGFTSKTAGAHGLVHVHRSYC